MSRPNKKSPPPLRGRAREGGPRKNIARARQFRRAQTKAEKKLWRALRRNLADGFYFRRQQPIGPYIVDFFCPRAKLIVELDGGSHTFNRGIEHDKIRTRWLEQRGYSIIRFWNDNIFESLDGVAGAILEALQNPPPSLTLPLKGGGDIASAKPNTSDRPKTKKDSAMSRKSPPPLRGRVREGGL